MSIYTGFFDSAFDEASGTYDHEYDSSDFVGYFEQLVGSGVCVRGNENSMQVYYDSGSNRAVVNPGYLFIRGYWLKNDGLYTVSLFGLGAGTYAILAQLNVGTRAITIGQVLKKDPESYPDALVLAYATVNDQGGVSIEDTRSRTDICGLIDSAGNLSNKVDYAINYINTEVEGRLDQIEQQLKAQSAELDGKIEEANDLVSQIEPPAAGTIKFSASQDIEEGWLRCDGSFITETNYPELVAALGKNYPSGDKFQLLNTEGIGRQISNGVVCEGRLWVFSYADRKLYGIDIEGDTTPKAITLTGDSNFLNWKAPSDQYPLVLSIVESKLSPGVYRIFLAQFSTGADVTVSKSSDTNYADTGTATCHPATELFYTSQFNSESDTLALKSILDEGEVTVLPDNIGLLSTTGSDTLKVNAYPSVVSQVIGGQEVFLCLAYFSGEVSTRGNSAEDIGSCAGYFRITFSGEDFEKKLSVRGYGSNGYSSSYGPQNDTPISGFLEEAQGEALIVALSVSSSSSSTSSRYSWGMYSLVSGLYNRDFTERTSSSLEFDSVKNIVAFPGLNWAVIQFNFESRTLWLIPRDQVSAPKKITISGPELPPAAKGFMKAQGYLWGKNMYMFFVGTGILFSRTLEADSFGYLDTSEVMGNLTQFASLLYSQDEMTLYIVGQDTTNSIKAAKIVLNTLYDYASDGAWLPLIASDGVPAYIKAIGEPPPPEPPAPVVFSNIQTKSEVEGGLPALTSIFNVTLNNETLSGGKNKEYPATSTLKMTALQDYTNPQSTELDFRIYFYLNNPASGYPVEENGLALLGKVLARGEQIKKGDEVQVSINMQDLKDSGYTCFYFITKAAQGS